ncbi:unnamed protein product [Orchesella dallaii]|uniref:Uncharacterized protein n=1 Tax=Orchesella dallaii TaxID=48710 RepID=A0ABP1RJQ6_9HEXA
MIYNIQLLLKAFRLHERLTTFYNSPHILYWGFNPKTQVECWQRRSQIPKSFLASIFVVALITIFFFGSMSIGINVILIISGNQFSEALNKLHQYSNYCVSRTRTVENKNGFQNNFKSKLPGTIATLSVAVTGLTTILLFPVAIYLKIDPIIWLPGYSHLVLPLRLVLSFVYIRESLRTAALCCLIISFDAPLFFHCLEYCDSFPIGNGGINAYQVLRRIRCINVKSCSDFTGVLLCCIHLLLVSGHVVVICGYDMLPFPILVLFIVCLVMIDIVLHTYLPWVSRIYDWSSGIIEKWRRLLGNTDKKGRRILRRKIAALRPIAFRCGSIGPLTRDTKRRYFKSIFEGFFDVVIAFQNGWGS